jgi:hypothetical protein
VNLDGVPVAPVTDIARHFGIALPADLKVEGTARGSVGYSAEPSAAGAMQAESMRGGIRVSGVTLAAQGSPPLKIAQADLLFSGSEIALSPASIVNDAGESAAIEGSYDTGARAFRLSLTSTGMSIVSLRREVSVAGAPVLGRATNGVWSGSLQFENGPAGGGWSGEIHLKDTDIPFEAFSRPIHLLNADASIDAADVTMKRLSLTVAGIAAQGEYSYRTGAEFPHRFRIWLPSADASELEAALAHSLRRGNLLAYAFNFGRAPEPDWLLNMHAEGSIEAGVLALGGTSVSRLRAGVRWNAMDVRLTGMTARVADAAFTGTAAIDLAGREPRYELQGDIAGFPWQGGTLTATGGLTTSGTGADLLANAHAEGTFTGRKLEVAPLTLWDSVEGTFDFAVARATPRLRLSSLSVQSGGTKWTGAAETQDGGQMVVKIADGARHLEASGALLRGEALKPVP